MSETSYPIQIKISGHGEDEGNTEAAAVAAGAQVADDALVVRLIHDREGERPSQAFVGSVCGQTREPLGFAQMVAIWISLGAHVAALSVTDPDDLRVQKAIRYCLLMLTQPPPPVEPTSPEA